MANVEWSARAMRSSSLREPGTRSWLQSRYAFSVAARPLMRTRIRISNNRWGDGFGRKLVAPPRAFRSFPTRFPSLAVDHIFVNPVLSPTDLNVYRTPLARLASDHFPLVCELTLKPNNVALGESDIEHVAI